ncbi:hypothetical protein EV361DRAFT_884584 [Lentinula raphanica]|nr:hypothetical protein EV361DRAFT_884584 [Lentinula raphanica]
MQTRPNFPNALKSARNFLLHRFLFSSSLHLGYTVASMFKWKEPSSSDRNIYIVTSYSFTSTLLVIVFS